MYHQCTVYLPTKVITFYYRTRNFIPRTMYIRIGINTYSFYCIIIVVSINCPTVKITKWFPLFYGIKLIDAIIVFLWLISTWKCNWILSMFQPRYNHTRSTNRVLQSCRFKSNENKYLHWIIVFGPRFICGW